MTIPAYISTDGTPAGTKVWDQHGIPVDNVTSIERRGAEVFVTTRHPSFRIDGVEGDFVITMPERWQPIERVHEADYAETVDAELLED